MQVIALQFVEKVRQLSIFKLTQHINNWEVGILFIGALFSLLLMSPHLGMEEFIVLFHMTKDMM
jgi:hypothetical protein